MTMCTIYVHILGRNMSTRLNRLEISLISKKLGWTFNKTREAINEYKSNESLIDHDEFLRVCINSIDPIDRIDNIAKLLTEQLDYSLDKSILKILEIDNIKKVLRVFNCADLESIKNGQVYVGLKSNMKKVEDPFNNTSTTESDDNSINKEVEFMLDKTVEMNRPFNVENEAMNGSFLRFPVIVVYISSKESLADRLLKKDLLLNKYIDLKELSYKLCDSYLNFKFNKPIDDKIKLMEKLKNKREHDELENQILKMYADRYSILQEVIISLFRIIKFEIFNMQYFKECLDIASRYYFVPEHSTFLKKIKEAFVDLDANKQYLTQRTNWFVYCLVEKIKQKGYKVKPACEIVGKLLELYPESVRARYYENRQIIKQRDKFNLDEFILKEGYLDALNNYLYKISSAQSD